MGCVEKFDRARLDKLLLGLLGNGDLVTLWWRSNNKAFNWETPEQRYVADPKAVVNYILQQYTYSI